MLTLTRGNCFGAYMCALKVNETGPTMKAAAIDRFGPPSVLKLHALPVPEPGPNEVLIALQAAGVGVWDADIRGGWWPSGRPRFPLVLGTDGAGVVVAKGARVRRFVWASVCGLMNSSIQKVGSTRNTWP